MQKTLSLIGCGNAGRTLARLWHASQTFQVQDVLTRSARSAQDAASFIGAGRPVDSYVGLRPADIYLIATPDDQIVSCSEQLARSGALSFGSIVFHLSGALRSSELGAVSKLGAAVAGIHPIRSFAAPEQVVQSFAGTWCGMEGDQRALGVLEKAFSAIGAQPVAIDADFKMLYHAAAVFASNYLVTLIDVAQQAYARAGVPDDVSLRLMEPLVRKTIDDVFRIGTAEALSGPIARGDMTTVDRQQQAVSDWNAQRGELYEQFTKLTTELAARRGKHGP